MSLNRLCLVINASYEAINVISKIDEPDLSSTAIFRRIGTSRFTMHAAYEIRGSSLDTVFREFAPDDFVKSLWLANQLPDKPMRAAGMFAISGRCLEIASQKAASGKQPQAPPKILNNESLRSSAKPR